MQTIRSWNDLEKFGIVPLTGEACGLSLRLLCDLTPSGLRIVQSMFSATDMKVSLDLRPAWNGSVIRLTGGEAPTETAHKSIMLPADMWRTLAVFALVSAGCHEVYLSTEGPVIGMTGEDFRAWKAEHGDNALAVLETNLRYTYGARTYCSPFDHNILNDDCPKDRGGECNCNPMELLCARVIRVPGTPGRTLLTDTPATGFQVGTLDERTRNTHQMSGRRL